MGPRIAILGGAAAAALALAVAGLERHSPAAGEGRLTLKSSEGSFSFDPAAAMAKMPAWLPLYPAPAEGVHHSAGGGESRHTYSFKTAEAPAGVAAFFQDRLTKNGFAVRPMMSEAGGLLSAVSADKKRSVTLTIVRAKAGTQAAVLAIEKK
jgi:hypothetical protein